MQKLWAPLATIFVKKSFEKIFVEVLYTFEVPDGGNFWYLKKNGVEKFYKTLFCQGPVVLVLIYDNKFSLSGIKMLIKEAILFGLS